MPVGAGISAAGAIGSSLIGANAAKGAASAQAEAASRALAMQQQIYQQNREAVQPYLDIGSGASNSLAKLYGLSTPGNPGGAQGVNEGWNAFTNLPAYQFPLQQGMLALTRNLNAQGLNQSGAQTKEAQQFGQGLAAQYMMSNYVTPLTSFMNTGAGSANSLLNAGTNAANGMAQSQLGIGQADASGILGAAKAYSGGIAGVTNSLSAYSYLSKQPGGNLGQFNPSSYSGGYGGGGGTSFGPSNYQGQIAGLY